MAKKLIFFAIIYLIIGYVIMKKRCEKKPQISLIPNIYNDMPYINIWNNSPHFTDPLPPTDSVQGKSCMTLINIISAPINQLFEFVKVISTPSPNVINSKCIAHNQSLAEGTTCVNCVPPNSQMANYKGVIKNGNCVPLT